MTGILYFEGRYDSTQKVIILKGKYINSEKNEVALRQTFRLADEQHFENDWYGTQPGHKEQKFTTKKMTKRGQV